MNKLTDDTPPVYIAPAKRECLLTDKATLETLEILKEKTIAAFKSLWHNPRFTPAQMLEARGTGAGLAFTLHAQAVQLILTAGLQMDPADYTPPLTYTIHEDGKVTIHQ